MGQDNLSVGADVADQAAFWDARLRNPDCSAEDRRAFEAWRSAAPEHRRAFEDLQDVLDALRAHSGRPNLRAMRDEALRARPRRFARWFAIAAAALVLSLGVWMLSEMPTPGVRTVAAPSERIETAAAERLYETNVGQTEIIHLEDGSSLTLNTQSRVLVHYTRARRELTLVRGEALFSVAHDPSRPFMVKAGNREVIAVGTEFSVRIDGPEVKVTLVEGRVNVERRDETVLSALMPGGRLKLIAGEELVAQGDGGARVTQASVEEALLWREGRIAFRDMPLTKAVAEMNRYSSDPIVISDPTMAQLKVNGVFRTGQMETFVSAIEEYFDIDAREQSDGDIILVWREDVRAKQ